MSLKEIISAQLQRTVLSCQIRGLYQSSAWAGEQLLGLGAPSADTTSNSCNIFSFCEENISLLEVPIVLMAQSLLAQGQYQRCAHNIRHYLTQSTQMSTQPSQLCMFLYLYSHYLSGEKLKLQETQQIEFNFSNIANNNSADKKKAMEPSPVKNLNLPDIYKEMLPMYKSNRMDGYLLYLFAVVIRDLLSQYGQNLSVAGASTSEIRPYDVFLLALATNPWNWSCWIEFEKYCIVNHEKLPSWEDICSRRPSMDNTDRQCGRLMYAFFMSHVYLEKHRGDLALQAMEKLKRIFPASLYLISHIGVAYYSQRIYDQALDCFEAVREKDPYRLQHVDTYSNILFVHEKSAELSHLAHILMKIEKYSPEVCCVVGNYYSLKGQHEKAVKYFQRALRLDASYLSAWTLMGHEYMELMNTAAAVQCYRHAVEVSETDYRAWYGLGQTYEMLHLYQYAWYYYKKAAFLRPADARMWSAVGNCLLKVGKKTEAIASYERAVSCGDREGIATRDLARLYREEAYLGKAADIYYKYLRCNLFDDVVEEEGMGQQEGEEDGRFPPTLEDFVVAWRETITADVSANGARMLALADNKFGGGSLDAQVDAEQAEALLFLASFCRSQAENLVAEFFCSRLLSFQGPEGDEARLMLKELRMYNSQLQQREPHASFGSANSSMAAPIDLSMLQESPVARGAANRSADYFIHKPSSRRLSGDEDMLPAGSAILSASEPRSQTRQSTGRHNRRRESMSFIGGGTPQDMMLSDIDLPSFLPGHSGDEGDNSVMYLHEAFNASNSRMSIDPAADSFQGNLDFDRSIESRNPR